MLPLYRDIAAIARYSPGGNAGLWYDKFCDKWQDQNARSTYKTPDSPPFYALSGEDKRRWISTVISRGPVGDRRHLMEHTSRLRALTHACGGSALELVTESPFVTGLGRPHPVENGFAWHHALGVPYLPGSSIKGLVKAWVRSGSYQVDSTVLTWFGDAGRIGEVCFLDATPLEPVQLAVDVMTPHYAGWTAANPPGDWMSPNPIPFLVVRPGARLLFCMLPQNTSVTSDDLRALRDHLVDALTWFGAGAKTAVGYGRFAERVSAPKQSDSIRSDVKLKVGDLVTAELLEEKTKKDGWRAREITSGRVGYIENTAAVPNNREAGDTVQLELRSDHANGTLAFRWPDR